VYGKLIFVNLNVFVIYQIHDFCVNNFRYHSVADDYHSYNHYQTFAAYEEVVEVAVAVAHIQNVAAVAAAVVVVVEVALDIAGNYNVTMNHYIHCNDGDFAVEVEVAVAVVEYSMDNKIHLVNVEFPAK
jgi:hypothetical protein